MYKLTKRQRFAAAAAAPLAVLGSVWAAAGTASSADRDTPTVLPSPPSRMEPLPSPISTDDAQRARAAGQGLPSAAQPSAEDVAEALGKSVEEARQLLDRSQQHRDGLSAIRPGPEEASSGNR